MFAMMQNTYKATPDCDIICTIVDDGSGDSTNLQSQSSRFLRYPQGDVWHRARCHCGLGVDSVLQLLSYESKHRAAGILGHDALICHHTGRQL